MLGLRRRGRRNTPAKPAPVQLTWGERLTELRTQPVRYLRHVRAERRRGRANNRPRMVVPVERNATGKFVERRDRMQPNRPYRTEFVPLRQMPSALFRFGKIRRNALPEPREVELQYSNKLGWHPVKQVLPMRSKSNTRHNRVKARPNSRANARRSPPAPINARRAPPANNALSRARRAALTRKAVSKPQLRAWSW